MLQGKNICYQYDHQPLLDGVSFTLGENEALCLLGESGSGKSTLLRIIAGLEQPDQGEVIWDDVCLNGVPAWQRNFGLMFQDYALFPHQTVFENVAFGLKLQKKPRLQIAERVTQLLDQVGMADFAMRKVTELSGGEQQRIALVRALAPAPRLLMLDEPLGALDHMLRVNLLAELRHVIGGNGIPSIYVTHDQEEAFGIADRIAILHGGKIEQIGVPEELVRAPQSVWIARFLGLNNFLSVSQAHDLGLHWDENDGFLLFREGEVISPDCHMADEALLNDRVHFSGKVRDCHFKGTGYEVKIEVAPKVVFSLFSHHPLEWGAVLSVQFPIAAVHWMKS